METGKQQVRSQEPCLGCPKYSPPQAQAQHWSPIHSSSSSCSKQGSQRSLTEEMNSCAGPSTRSGAAGSAFIGRYSPGPRSARDRPPLPVVLGRTPYAHVHVCCVVYLQRRRCVSNGAADDAAMLSRADQSRRTPPLSIAML
ncbi:hypothetical protein ZWY2020_032768 [Hordeum vulgare]|nr:hypothetical protein ZWY2020_032768 [Hordeum vulgare]